MAEQAAARYKQAVIGLSAMVVVLLVVIVALLLRPSGSSINTPVVPTQQPAPAASMNLNPAGGQPGYVIMIATANGMSPGERVFFTFNGEKVADTNADSSGKAIGNLAIKTIGMSGGVPVSADGQTSGTHVTGMFQVTP